MVRSMRSSMLSMLVFGFYYLVAGSGYLVLPGFVSSRLDFSAGGEIWVRFAGLLLLMLGYLYLQAGRKQLIPFFRWSAHIRLFSFLAFVVLWLMGVAETIVLIFAAIEIAGALWTWLSLPHE